MILATMDRSQPSLLPVSARMMASSICFTALKAATALPSCAAADAEEEGLLQRATVAVACSAWSNP